MSQVLLEMFVDTSITEFFQCDHNNNQLSRIVDYFSKSTESKVATRPPLSRIHLPFTSHSGEHHNQNQLASATTASWQNSVASLLLWQKSS